MPSEQPKIDLDLYDKELPPLLDSLAHGVKADYDSHLYPNTPPHTPIVFITVSNMRSWRFNIQRENWYETEPGQLTTRNFEIFPDGIICENAEKAGYFPWFKVNSHYEAFWFIQMLTTFSAKSLKPFQSQTVTIDSLIDDLFAPFYGNAVDIPKTKNNQRWVNVKPIAKLIEIHIANKLSWLKALLFEQRLKDLNNEISKTPEEGIEHPMSGGNVSAVDHNNMLQSFFREEFGAYEKLGAEYSSYSSKLKKSDYLTTDLSHKTFDYNLIYDPEEQWGASQPQDNKILIKALLNKGKCSPLFFSKEVNPEAFSRMELVIRGRCCSVEPNDSKSLTIELPPIHAQTRIAFETRCYAFQITRYRDSLCHFEADENEPFNYSTQCQMTIARYRALRRIVESNPSDDMEIARVVQPLPFFCEIPILHWERPYGMDPFQASSTCLKEIIKTTCLIGLEELHAVRSNVTQLAPFPKRLLESITQAPSLGHWSQMIDYLAKVNEHFTVWNQWIEVMHSYREQIILLITLRNRISHPDFILTPKHTAKAALKYDEVLKQLIPKLRAAVGEVDLLLPTSRKITQSDDGRLSHSIQCLNLKTPNYPFHETAREFANTMGSQIFEEVIFASKGETIVPLNNFFKVKQIDNSLEVFLYEKQYKGSTANMVGILTNSSKKIDSCEGMFSFGC
jgi:hypothetical protein